MNANSSDREDLAFIRFVTEHWKALTAVSVIPVFSAHFDVVQPPADGLDILSAFTSLLVFTACFTLRDSIRRLIGFWTIVPFLLAFASIVLATAVTALYFARDDLRRDVETIALYLSIFPLYVLGVSIVMVTAYVQQLPMSVQHIIDNRQLLEREEEIERLVEGYVSFLTSTRKLPENDPLKQIGSELLADWRRQIEALGTGRIEVPGSFAPHIQGILMQKFTKRFTAVSDRDLQFWASQREDVTAREYFKLGIEAVTRGTEVSRIFVFSNRDLERDLDLVEDVLRQHTQHKIGWAVVPYCSLGPSILKSGSLDFALYDDDAAASFFVDYHESASRMYTATFRYESKDEKVALQAQLYQALAPHCWLVSKHFEDQHPDLAHNDDLARQSVDQRVVLGIDVLPEGLATDSAYLLRLDQDASLRPALDFLAGLVSSSETSLPSGADLDPSKTQTAM